MEDVELKENGPVKYVWRSRHGQRERVTIRSERVQCAICGSLFWRWRGAEGDECPRCQWEGKRDVASGRGFPVQAGRA